MTYSIAIMRMSPEPQISLAIRVLYLIKRLSSSGYAVSKFLTLPLRVFYRLYSLFVLGIDLPTSTSIGKELKIFHGFGLVVSARSIIGNNVTLRQCTTIGVISQDGRGPTLEDDVEVGANVVIIGEINIGKGSKIGAGSVVINSVPPYSIVVGNPGRCV